MFCLAILVISLASVGEARRCSPFDYDRKLLKQILRVEDATNKHSEKLQELETKMAALRQDMATVIQEEMKEAASAASTDLGKGTLLGKAAQSGQWDNYYHRSIAEALSGTCAMPVSTGSEAFFKRDLERLGEKYACVNSQSECLDFKLPRHYIAYHLNGKPIEIDGQLEEVAWREVPWSEDFVDMRSSTYPAPYLKTKFKMRWDENRMYIAARLEETNLWATYTDQDAKVFLEHGFEMLMDVDGSMFNYKQVQVNVLGTLNDQILYKSPHDVPDKETVKEKSWHPEAEHKVYAEGTINTPGDIDKYWNVEMAFTFIALAKKSLRTAPKPSDDEVWFLQFGRSEQQLNVSNGEYFKIPGSKPDWWSWQACDTINLHLQNRWGLVQFKRKRRDKTFTFQKWHIYKSLFDMMDGLKKYKGIHGRYTDNIQELDIPPYLLSGTCVETPEIELTTRDGVQDFDVVVRSKILLHMPAHIRSDRYVTFD